MGLNDTTRELMARINKKHGAGAVVVASEMQPVPRFPSGSLSLDVMLGGGWPGNQWNEILGQESSGKTTIVHKTIAANQKADPEFTTLWIAAEGYDYEWAEKLGVDISRVLVYSTNAMEDAYAAMIQAADSRAVDAIVLDSYPALVADDEQEKEMDQATMASGARVTGKFFRKVGNATRRSLIEKDRPLLGLIINQWRDQIGGWAPNGATPKTSPGGKAKNYAYYCRLEVSRTEWIDEKRPGGGARRVGQVIKLKTLKNKAAAPQQVASLKFYFSDTDSGFVKGEYDLGSELVAQGLLHGVITASGAWLYYGDQKWNGKDKMAAAIREDLDLQGVLWTNVLLASRPVA